MSVEDYKCVTQIGEGTFGHVFKGELKKSGQIVALKKIRMEKEREGFPVTALREIKFLRKLSHKNIVNLLRVVTSNSSVFLVFEYAAFDLNALLSNGWQVDIPSAKNVLKQLLRALEHIHSKGILHRDMKSSNILVTKDGLVKLADFGLAKCINSSDIDNQSGWLTNRVVTLWYRPLELLLGSTDYTEAIDMWGVGCIFLEMFNKKPPFQGTDEIEQVQKITETLGDPAAEWPEIVNLPWTLFLRFEPKESFKEKFPFIDEKVLTFIRRFLHFDPARRISASNALNTNFFTEDPPTSDNLNLPEEDLHEYEFKRRKRKEREGESK